jgi:H+/gluconate symporter-like permease
MEIGIISLIGVLVGLIVFITLAFRSFNLQLAALIATVVMLLFAGSGENGYLSNIYNGIFTTWIGGVAGALKAYFLIFCFGSMFGLLMARGGATKRIAFTIAGAIRGIQNPVTKKVMAAFFVPLLYIILSYVGISGFVIVFTVLYMGMELFRECDIPWRMYCMGGASCASTIILGGAIQVANVAAGEITGTNNLMAGMGISVIGFALFIVTMIIMIRFELQKAEKNGETFMTTGTEFVKNSQSSGSAEGLPNIVISVVPMIAVIVCAILKINVSLALLIGCIVSIILYWKWLNEGGNTCLKVISEGMTSAYVPLMSVCCTVAMGTVIQTLPGFQQLLTMMGVLPSLAQGVGLMAVFSFIMASSTSAVPAFGAVVFEKFSEAGLTPALSHRMMVMSSAPFGIMFHNAGVVNASTLAKIEYKKAVSVYIRYSCLPALPGLIIALILISVGILH